MSALTSLLRPNANTAVLRSLNSHSSTATDPASETDLTLQDVLKGNHTTTASTTTISNATTTGAEGDDIATTRFISPLIDDNTLSADAGRRSLNSTAAYSTSPPTNSGGGEVELCWVDMALPTLHYHVGRLRFYPVTKLRKQQSTRPIYKEVRVRMFLNPGWNLSISIDVEPQYSDISRLSLKADGCTGLYNEDSLGSSGITSVRKYRMPADDDLSKPSTISSSGDSRSASQGPIVEDDDCDDSVSRSCSSSDCRGDNEGMILHSVTELTFDLKADFRETPNVFADWRRRQIAQLRRGSSALQLDTPIYSAASPRHLSYSWDSFIDNIPIFGERLFSSRGGTIRKKGRTSRSNNTRRGSGAAYNRMHSAHPDLMTFTLCLYSTENDVTGISVGKVRFLPDQRDAAELVALMMFYAMAVPLLCGATLSCYIYRSQQRRKTLRRVRLVQQYDHIERRLLMELGGVGRSDEMASPHDEVPTASRSPLLANRASSVVAEHENNGRLIDASAVEMV
eukprot:Lankesteria_metandrocarpae@DN1626_c0_g1_i1.p1